jgi:hypothetical protein
VSTTGTHRPPKRTWRWRVAYRPKPGQPERERVAYTRDEAEQIARREVPGLPATATEIQVIHVDHAGWRTVYPIRSTEGSTS